MDYPADQVIAHFVDLGITHVVWLPDSALGPWEQALATSDNVQLVRVCREGEAWAIAAGLYLGGKLPLVVIQNTGFFESGDAMRNVLFDLRLPLLAVVGYRSYLVHGSTDSLLVAEITFGCLDRHVAEQELDLLQLSAGGVA